MKNLRNLIAVTIISVFAFGTTFAANDDNEITRLREAVENASASDWQIYADAAERCIELETNMSEAYIWLERAIEINPNARNLELKGDYLAVNGAKEMAIEAYRQSILKAISDNDGYDVSKVQKKLLNLAR
ncbi:MULTISPECIES: hypothetical protein [Flammeovirga]|uniref:Tetratricopeptide repeat protein n=1 Tax=Flammeovirga agarivorans TaxID=2726742 RepID=A0A7X8SGJ5_9BACT|nr:MULTISPECIES: hypothetical protein [Flammeovirga]NLR89737.1 hypothetical protein [Flammeovirga agarivorans]